MSEKTRRVYIGRYDNVNYMTKSPIKRMQVVEMSDQEWFRYKEARKLFITVEEFDAHVDKVRHRKDLEAWLIGRWERQYSLAVSPYGVVTDNCKLELLKYFTKIDKEKDLLSEACDAVGLDYINEGPTCTKDKLIKLCEHVGFDYAREELPRGDLIVHLKYIFGIDHPKFSTKKEEE
jgi:hypothetical protein